MNSIAPNTEARSIIASSIVPADVPSPAFFFPVVSVSRCETKNAGGGTRRAQTPLVTVRAGQETGQKAGASGL